MNRIILSLFVLLGSLHFGSAQAVEFHSSRTLSLGGSGRANPMLTDSIYLNPSYASFAPVYSLSGTYLPIQPHGRNYNVSIQDSRNELFQGGIGYTKREGTSAVNVGASKLAFNRLGFGLGSKFIINDNTNKITSDLILSTSYLVSSFLYATLVIDNLLANLDQTFYLGTKFVPTKNVNIYIDPFYSPGYSNGKKAGYHAGVELGLLADFFLRGGKYQDAEIPYLGTRGSGFGIGGGWLGPRINIEYAFSRAIQTDRNDSTISVNSFSTTVFF